MIDFETTLREHLEQRAAEIDVHPDIDAVIGDHTVVVVAESIWGSRRRLWVAIAAAALVLLLAAGLFGLDRQRSSPADIPPRPVPTNGLIVVNSDVDGVADPVVIDPEGKGRSSDLPADVLRGTWSPDATRVAFATGATISVFELDTRSSTVIGSCDSPTNSAGGACSVAWSNDGRTVATAAPGAIELFDAISPSSAPVASFALGGHDQPGEVVWTEHDRLVFIVRSVLSANDIPLRVDSMNPDGSDRRTILGPFPGESFADQAVHLSPDGTSLVWIEVGPETTDDGLFAEKLMMLTVGDSGPRMVRVVGGCGCNAYWPAVSWSPDGKRLALVLAGTGLDEEPQDRQHSNLYVADADGSNGKYLGRATGVPTWQAAAAS